MVNLAPSVATTTNSVTQEVSLGTRYADQYGRVFRYCKAGGSGLDRGKLVVTSDPVANHTSMNFAVAPAIGDTSVDVTLGGTAATANQYKDGWLNVQDGLGEGRVYRVEGHAAQATTTGTLKVWLAEPIDTVSAITVANVDLVYNKYQSIVIAASDQADVPVGIPVAGITTLYYGWVQTWGPCAAWMDEAVAIGQDLTIGSSVPGSVELRDAAGEPFVGTMGPITGVDDEYTMIYLQIDR